MKKTFLLFAVTLFCSSGAFAHYDTKYYSFVPQSPVIYYYPKTPVYYYPGHGQFGQPSYYYYYPNFFSTYYYSRTIAFVPHQSTKTIDRGFIFGQQTRQPMQPQSIQPTGTVKEIRMTLSHFFGYNPSTITVNQGDIVRILATTELGTGGHFHGITIDAFGVNEAITSETTPKVIEFVASMSGAFQIRCGTCAMGTHFMLGGPNFSGKLIVLPRQSIQTKQQSLHMTTQAAVRQATQPY